MNARDALGIAGSLLLLVGVFMPMVRVPVMGRLSYFEIAPEAGTVLALLAGLGMLLVNARQYRYLWIVGAASLGVAAFGLLRSGGGNRSGLVQSLTDMASRSAKLEWGLAVIAVAVVLLIVAGAGFGARRP